VSQPIRSHKGKTDLLSGTTLSEPSCLARSMALNQPAVCQGLHTKGIDIPEKTMFLGCPHDTPTGIVAIFERHVGPSA